MSSTQTYYCALICALLVARASCANEADVVPRHEFIALRAMSIVTRLAQSFQRCTLKCLRALDSFAMQGMQKADTVKVCKRDETDYSNCLTNAVQDSWPTFIQGIPSLNLPALDPIQSDLVENNLKTVSFVGSVSLRDLKIHGLATSKILAVRSLFTDDDRIQLDMDIEIPKVLIECNYHAKGAVGPFSIGGKGFFNITMDDLTATWSLDGHVKNDRWIVEHFRIDPEIQGMHVYFSDLLNGNEKLNSAALSIVNGMWPLFFKAMKPIINILSDPPLTNFVNNRIFSKVPISQIFP